MSDRMRPRRSPHPDFPIIPQEDESADSPGPRHAPANNVASTFLGVFLALFAFFVVMPVVLTLLFFGACCTGFLGVFPSPSVPQRATPAEPDDEKAKQIAEAIKAEEEKQQRRRDHEAAERKAEAAKAKAEQDAKLAAEDRERKRLDKIARDEEPAAEALKLTLPQIKFKGPFARQWLQEIIRDYPGTTAAGEAARMLKEYKGK